MIETTISKLREAREEGVGIAMNLSHVEALLDYLDALDRKHTAALEGLDRATKLTARRDAMIEWLRLNEPDAWRAWLKTQRQEHDAAD